MVENPRFMNGIIRIFLVLFFVSCTNKTGNKTIASKTEASKPLKQDVLSADTLNTAFPAKVGGFNGTVNIKGIRNFKNDTLIASDFLISLDDISIFNVSRRVDKKILIDYNKFVYFKDTVNLDYLNNAVLKSVEFDVVRANTLYFSAILENPIEGKEIHGRFNLFYKTDRKGIVYGWITDEVRETSKNTK